jgi:two-component system sensor histidine kinase MprB
MSVSLMTQRSLGLRLAIASAGAVAVAIVIASGAMYFAVQRSLISETDALLASRAAQIRPVGHRVVLAPPPGRFDMPGAKVDVITQYIDSSGNVVVGPFQGEPLPVGQATRDVAAGRTGQFTADITVDDERYRVLTVPLQSGFAVQVARPLTEMDAVLGELRLTLLGVLVVGVLVAAAVGGLVARAGLAPLDRLTKTIEELTRTRDLTRRVAVGGRDELGRLAENFNSLLAALESSLRSQRQLVADASHELRTPITSLRTNLEVLQRTETWAPGEREHLLGEVVHQTERLGHLVAELIDLAREEEGAPVAVQDVALDEIGRSAVAVAAQEWPGVEFSLVAEPCVVRGDPGRIERAIRNLLDNAAKWSPPGGVIDVSVSDGEVAVRDHGPGVAEADLPHVFDRFWRAPAARRMPGSGLGLAIVKEIARAHGGTVGVERAEGGGALFRLRFPTIQGGLAHVAP